MRKPRAVIFNFSQFAQHKLTAFFQDNGYDIVVEKGPTICPVYKTRASNSCAGPVPCCDIMIASHDIEQDKGIGLFSTQSRLGCRLTSRNKAIVVGPPARERLTRAAVPGIALFESAPDSGVFESWVRECERRMDLTQKLAVMRRSNRHASAKQVKVRLPGEGVEITAQTVNISSCGVCLLTSEPLKQGQTLQLVNLHRLNIDEGIVRWAKKLDDEWHLTGVTFCV